MRLHAHGTGDDDPVVQPVAARRTPAPALCARRSRRYDAGEMLCSLAAERTETFRRITLSTSRGSTCSGRQPRRLHSARARRSPARTRSAMRLRSRWAMVKTAWSSGEPVLYATFRRHYGERMPTQRGSELRRFASLDPSLFGESDCPRPEALRGTI